MDDVDPDPIFVDPDTCDHKEFIYYYTDGHSIGYWGCRYCGRPALEILPPIQRSMDDFGG